MGRWHGPCTRAVGPPRGHRASPGTRSPLRGTQRLLPRCVRKAFPVPRGDRKSTRLNSSHRTISYAVFCLKKKNNLDELRMLPVIADEYLIIVILVTADELVHCGLH